MCLCELTVRLQASRERLARDRVLARDLHRVAKETVAYISAAVDTVRARLDPEALPSGPPKLCPYDWNDLARAHRQLLRAQLAMADAQLTSSMECARVRGYATGSRHMAVLRRAERTHQRLTQAWRAGQL